MKDHRILAGSGEKPDNVQNPRTSKEVQGFLSIHVFRRMTNYFPKKRYAAQALPFFRVERN